MCRVIHEVLHRLALSLVFFFFRGWGSKLSPARRPSPARLESPGCLSLSLSLSLSLFGPFSAALSLSLSLALALAVAPRLATLTISPHPPPLSLLPLYHPGSKYGQEKEKSHLPPCPKTRNRGMCGILCCGPTCVMKYIIELIGKRAERHHLCIYLSIDLSIHLSLSVSLCISPALAAFRNIPEYTAVMTIVRGDVTRISKRCIQAQALRSNPFRTCLPLGWSCRDTGAGCPSRWPQPHGNDVAAWPCEL